MTVLVGFVGLIVVFIAVNCKNCESSHPKFILLYALYSLSHVFPHSSAPFITNTTTGLSPPGKQTRLLPWGPRWKGRPWSWWLCTRIQMTAMALVRQNLLSISHSLMRKRGLKSLFAWSPQIPWNGPATTRKLNSISGESGRVVIHQLPTIV